MVSVTPKTRTLVNGTANDATPVEQNFVELYNNDQTLATTVTPLESAFIPARGRYWRRSAAPVYLSSTTFSIDWFSGYEENFGDLINVLSSATINIANVGLNGQMQQATTNAGTITVNTGTTGVTGVGTTFTSDYAVGDTLLTAGGQTRRITVVGGNTTMTVESNWGSTETGVTHRRGTRAPNTWVYVYAISNGTTGTSGTTSGAPGYIVSTRNRALNGQLIDLPSGYTQAKTRQLPIVLRLDSSANILPFVMLNWGHTPTLIYSNCDFTAAPYNLLVNQTAIAYTTLTTTTQAPPQARQLYIAASLGQTGGAGGAAVRVTGQTNGITLGDFTAAGNTNRITNCGFFVPCNSSQQFDYTVTGGAQLTMGVRGYTIDGVN